MGVLGLAVKAAKKAAERMAEETAAHSAVRTATQLPLFAGNLEEHTAKLRKANLDRFLGKSVMREPQMSTRETQLRPPVRVYHATTSAPFDQFKINPQGVRPGKTVDRNAIFAAEDPEFANKFVETYLKHGGDGTPHLLPLWMRAERPVDFTNDGLDDLMGTDEEDALSKLPGLWHKRLIDDLHNTDEGDRWRVLDNTTHSGFFGEMPGVGHEVVSGLKSLGYDSVRMREAHPSLGEDGGMFDTWAAFSPNQFKSAIGNRGTFDPTDPRLHRARGGRVSSLAVKRKAKK